jgi:putative ABC transport system permease protein
VSPGRRRRLVDPAVPDDVERELRFHLEMRQRELEEEGWSPEEARREASRRFGNRERIREACMAIEKNQRRARERARFTETLVQDLGFAVRTLVRSPGFTAVALVTLALGIGINTALFSVVNGVLLRPLDFPEPDRLVTVNERSETGREIPVAWPNFQDWRAGTSSFEGMAAWASGSYTVVNEGGAERVSAATVTQDFFPVMGVLPLLGRGLGPSDFQEGTARVAVVSHGLWLRMFGGETELDRLQLRLGSSPLPVVGVMPPGFSWPQGVEAWMPMVDASTQWSRTAHNWRVVARLGPGVSLERGAAEVEAVTQRLREVHAGEIDAAGAVVTDLRTATVGGVRRPLYLLLGAALLVLLVACCNLSSTLLARAAARRREMAIRSALGAGRGRVVRQLLTESMVLTLGGALLGVVVALGLLRILLALAPPTLPRTAAVGIDPTVLLFTLALSVSTALVFGLVPALSASKGDLRGSLAEGGRGTAGSGRPLAWHLLVGSEVALALVLLVGAGLLTRSFAGLLAVDPGFQREGLLTASVTLPPPTRPASFDDPASMMAAEAEILELWGRILPATAASPGVRSAGFVNYLPLSGMNANGLFLIADALPPLDGLDGADMNQVRAFMGPLMQRIQNGEPGVGGDAGYRIVGGDYFQAMGIPLLEGRFFSSADDGRTGHVALVNETMARSFWPGESPVGKRILTGGMDRWGAVPTTIVGVVGDVRHSGPATDPYPEYFLHYLQRPARGTVATLVFRAEGDPSPLVPPLRARLREVAPEVPATFVTMNDRMALRTAQERFSMAVLGAFAVLALVLAAVGIYGVVSYAVARRTREMGIRIALGATPRGVRGLVVRGSMASVLGGAAAGLALTLVLGRWMESLLHGVGTRDPVTLVVVTGLLLLAGWLATFIPARKGTRVDPIITMRAE